MDFKKVYDIMQKCDICLGKAVISDEYIMTSFLKFLTGTVSDERCSRRGIALHINSPCFMAVSVVWSAFSAILSTGMDVEQIVRSLRPGDPVIRFIHLPETVFGKDKRNSCFPAGIKVS